MTEATKSAALNEVEHILESINSQSARIPGTLLYNEGWLLRLALAAGSKDTDCLPFRFEANARWFSEALLYSRFLPRFRGDTLSESWTHADGVVGQFRFGAATKAGLELEPKCSQFVVCEAKIFSALSAGTKRAPEFNQAARNVGCIAETLCRAQRPLPVYKSLGFFVMAPGSQIESGVFQDLMHKDAIRSRLAERVRMYQGQSNHAELQKWLNDWALPVVERIEMGCCSWESVIKRVKVTQPEYGTSLDEFYKLCLKYNAGANDASLGTVGYFSGDVKLRTAP
jgi:hypothetical protein